MGIFSRKPKKVEESPKVVDEDALRDKEEAAKAADEKQVELAYRFMMQPDVQKASDTMKRTFLRKKGLTHAQIDKAFERRDKKKEEPAQLIEPVKPADTVATAPAAQETPLPSENAVVKVDEESLEQKFERAYQTGFLSLKNQKLQEIDEKVFQISNLKTLILSQNPFQGVISDLIGNLTNLRTLQISDCNLNDKQLSEKIFSLPNLVELNISRNRLSHISLIGNLPLLQRLDVSQNDIVEIPEEIQNCTQLSLLNIQNNHISYLPHSFVSLKGLKRIMITGNSFDQETVQALQTGGIEGLFKHLSTH